MISGASHSIDFEMAPVLPARLDELLNRRVVVVEAEDFVLTLTFDSGARVIILSDLGPYECGQIYPGDADSLVTVF